MTPLRFGPAGRSLFGLFHASDAVRVQPSAVLICPPFGHEAIRSHRIERILAERLSRTGHDVLRFDYFGTGDSDGDDLDGDLSGWTADVLAAHAELKRRAPAARVIWMGARLGATLAVQAAQRGAGTVDRLLLWDPVLNGKAYADILRTRHVASLEERFFMPDGAWRRQLKHDPLAFANEAIGFAISPRLREELLSLSAGRLALPASLPTRLVARSNDALAYSWVEGGRTTGCDVSFVPLDHQLDWTADPEPYAAMVPAAVVQKLLAQCND